MKLRQALCAAVLFAGVSSPVAGDIYVVGTKQKEKEEAATKEIFGRPKGETSFEYEEITSNRLPGGPSLSSKKVKDRVPERRPRKLPADESSMSAGTWLAPQMSTETLEYLTAEVITSNMRQELRAMAENAWLEPYEDHKPLPPGEKITFLSLCTVAAARTRMKELGIEVPGSEKTPDIQFSWYHIHYGDGDAEPYVVPARLCEKPGNFWTEEGGCVIHFNRVHYRKVLEYAEEWKRQHPDTTECFVYQPTKPAEAPILPLACRDPTELIVIKKW